MKKRKERQVSYVCDRIRRKDDIIKESLTFSEDTEGRNRTSGETFDRGSVIYTERNRKAALLTVQYWYRKEKVLSSTWS